MVNTSPNTNDATEAVRITVERCAPEFVHSALIASPG